MRVQKNNRKKSTNPKVDFLKKINKIANPLDRLSYTPWSLTPASHLPDKLPMLKSLSRILNLKFEYPSFAIYLLCDLTISVSEFLCH